MEALILWIGWPLVVFICTRQVFINKGWKPYAGEKWKAKRTTSW